MSLTSRLICLAVLFFSFLLMLASGKTNLRNFQRVQSSIEEIYEDRLVVKGLIYELSSLLHEKELALAADNINFFKSRNSIVNKKIDEHLVEFRQTKLTEKEEKTLNFFSKGVEKLKTAEREGKFSYETDLSDPTSEKINKRIQSLKEDLKILSGIQLEEGQQKLKTGSHAVKQMNELAAIENIALILVGLMMVAIVLIPGPDKKFLWNSEK